MFLNEYQKIKDIYFALKNTYENSKQNPIHGFSFVEHEAAPHPCFSGHPAQPGYRRVFMDSIEEELNGFVLNTNEQQTKKYL